MQITNLHELSEISDTLKHDYIDIMQSFNSDINLNNVIQLYHRLDPLTIAILMVLFWSISCLILSLVTRNYSHVDRLWSIVPVLNTFYFAIWTSKDFASIPLRQWIMFSLTLAWGLRLTFNFLRKGGYTLQGEDYRWAYVKRDVVKNEVLWFVFNVFFICLFQHTLLMLIAAPAYIVHKHPEVEFGLIDTVATASFLILLLVEVVADEQQWRFQTKKYKLIKEKKQLTKDFKDGFLQSGLFKYSRHPNFFAEISMWWCFYLFTVSVTKTWINYGCLGAILLTSLFQGSTWLTEKISLSKYKAYKQYQRRTSRIIPWVPTSVKQD